MRVVADFYDCTHTVVTFTQAYSSEGLHLNLTYLSIKRNKECSLVLYQTNSIKSCILDNNQEHGQSAQMKVGPK